MLKSTIAQHEKQEKRMQLQLVAQKEQFEKQINALRSEKAKFEQSLVSMEASHRKRVAEFQSKDTAHRKRIGRLEDKLHEVGGHGLTVDNRLTWVSSHLDMIDLFYKSDKLVEHRAHFVNQAKNLPDVKDKMEATRQKWILDDHIRRVNEGREQFISAMKAAREVAPLMDCEAGASNSPAGVVSDPEGTRDNVTPHMMARPMPSAQIRRSWRKRHWSSRSWSTGPRSLPRPRASRREMERVAGRSRSMLRR